MGNGPGRDRFEEHTVGATLIGVNLAHPVKIQGYLLVIFITPSDSGCGF